MYANLEISSPLSLLSSPLHQGETHRLEIHPNPNDTVLHVGDLNGGEGSSELLLKDSSGDYQKKVQCLKAQMDHLKAEVRNPTRGKVQLIGVAWCGM